MEASVTAAIHNLHDSHAEVREDAAFALGALSKRTQSSTNATHSLIAALGDTNPRVRASAATALGQICDASAAESLAVALMNDANRVPGVGVEIVRVAAAEAILKMRDPRAVGALLTVVGCAYKEHVALEALVEIGRPAVGPLVAALANRYEDVRSCAKQAQAKIDEQWPSSEWPEPLSRLVSREYTSFRCS